MNRAYLPPIRHFSLQLFVPYHFAAGGFVGLAVLVGEVKLDEPVVVDRLRQSFQFGNLLAIQLDLLVQASENARYR